MVGITCADLCACHQAYYTVPPAYSLPSFPSSPPLSRHFISAEKPEGRNVAAAVGVGVGAGADVAPVQTESLVYGILHVPAAAQQQQFFQIPHPSLPSLFPLLLLPRPRSLGEGREKERVSLSRALSLSLSLAWQRFLQRCKKGGEGGGGGWW